MSLVIVGMDMPDEDMEYIRILKNGTVIQYCGYGRPVMLGHAVAVPPHGRLIDADKLRDACSTDNKPKVDWGYTPWYEAQDMIDSAPTVIEAEEVYCKCTDTAGNFHMVRENKI